MGSTPPGATKLFKNKEKVLKVEWEVDTEEVKDHHNFSFRVVTKKMLKVGGVPVKDLSDKGLDEAREFFFDRWTWVTNDPNDREVFEVLDKELEYRKSGEGPRKLRASWTMEAQQDLELDCGINLEEEITNIILKELESKEKI